MLTPSPKMSSSSTTMSPWWMPMRNSMRRSGGSGALLLAIAACISAAQRVDDAGELDQEAVAGGLDDAALVLGDLRIEELAAQLLEAFERALLVCPHQPRIPRHIGGEDRGETTGRGHQVAGSVNHLVRQEE